MRRELTIRLFVVGALSLLLGCTGESDADGSSEEESWPSPDPVTEAELLSPEASLSRVSMALRGVRPSAEDLAAIKEDPDRLVEFAEAYVDSPEFGETVKDMYAELLLMRSVELTLPAAGDLREASFTDMSDALGEETLDIIREVVMSDESFGAIVTADWTVLGEDSSKLWGGHNYDAAAGGLQRVSWTDGRPAAGILTTGSFLVRHDSDGANYHRGRASIVADKLLCQSFSERDIPITGDIDLADDEAVADALNTNAQCVSCHQSVDPLAANFWAFRNRLTGNQINRAFDAGCDPSLPPQFSCYPVQMYNPAAGGNWRRLGLRAPNYWGAAVNDMSELGEAIAEDPRFSLCAAQNFTRYLTQSRKDELNFEAIARYQRDFIASGLNAKALAVAIVTDPAFLTATPVDADETIAGVQVMRPEQLERALEALTSFRVEYAIPNNNLGTIRAMKNDQVGFRAMAGGIDGANITSPTHTPTPVKLLVFAAYAEDAAGYAVREEFQRPAAERTLLGAVEPDTVDEASVKAQLSQLSLVVFGQSAAPDSEEVAQLWTLWEAVNASSDPPTAWTTTLAAMFQSPDMMFY